MPYRKQNPVSTKLFDGSWLILREVCNELCFEFGCWSNRFNENSKFSSWFALGRCLFLLWPFLLPEVWKKREENGHSRIQLRLPIPSILRTFYKNTRNTETPDTRWIAAAETQRVLFGRGRKQYDAQVFGFSIRWFPAFCRTCPIRSSLLSSYPHHTSFVTSNSGMHSRSAPFRTLQNLSSRSFVIFVSISWILGSPSIGFRFSFERNYSSFSTRISIGYLIQVR